MSAPVAMNIFNQMNSVSTGNYIKNTVLASHTGRTIVPLGGVGTNSLYFAFNNPSPTETVNVFTDGSSGPIFAELRPATSGVMPVPAAITPYVEATGSIDVEIEYLMYGR